MKKLFALSTSLVTFTSFVPHALASGLASGNIGDPCTDPSVSTGFNTLCKLGLGGKIGPTIGSLINLIFLLAAIIALFFLAQGGIKWITSEGDTKNVEGARNQIIAAAVGLGITFLSYLIINLLLNFFLGTSLGNLQLPRLQGS